MVTNFAETTGEVNDRLVQYLSRRAKGGAALITVEGAYISKEGQGFSREVGIHNDDLIPGLANLTKTLKGHGAKAAIQLLHSGRQTRSAVTGQPIVAPSAIPCPVVQETPLELGRKGIEKIKKDYGKAAQRAKWAGFDSVEVHAAHGYLVHQFLSPLSNHRNDEYGGSKENRLRFAHEVLKEIRQAVGENYPIILRIDGSEFLEGGIDFGLASYYCESLAPEVQALHVTAGSYGAREWIAQPYSNEPGLLVPMASEIKRKVDIPVITVGRIHTPELAKQVIRNKDADFVAIGRGLLADPDFPLKILENRENQIVSCLSCYIGCSDRLRSGLDISCVVNPWVGKEESQITKIKKKKKILIIGGGPAGLTAASILAERGAKVTLVEERKETGGQFLLASRVPFKDGIRNIIRLWHENLGHLQVTFIQKKATADWVRQQAFDRLILATGTRPVVPKIRGLDLIHWMTFEKALQEGVQETDVMVVGGGATGCELSELLIDQGKKVTLVEMLDQLASNMGNMRPILIKRLTNKGVTFLVNTRVLEIKETSISIQRGEGKIVSTKKPECLVFACGVTANNDLEKSLGKMEFEHYTIGDSLKPRNAFWAVRDGFEVSLGIK